VTDPQPPVFEFDGMWPFTGNPVVNGHPLTTVSSFDVRAAPDGIPVVTLTLVGAGALKLIFASGAATAEVADETREALVSLGWTPPGT
jgi:hypothetical protein